ncbi:hypothetical protein HS7_06890 [Sulfolobales archaeon HS-7]|nr:hypothetical protein HS7_06890 [Sulfolobales archaeon HS-7]
MQTTFHDILDMFIKRDVPYILIRPISSEILDGCKLRDQLVLIVYDGKKRRAVNLSVLCFLYNKCSKEFVRDYLNMNLPLTMIQEKYGVANELEFASICISKNPGEYREYFTFDMFQLLLSYSR